MALFGALSAWILSEPLEFTHDWIVMDRNDSAHIFTVMLAKQERAKWGVSEHVCAHIWKFSSNMTFHNWKWFISLDRHRVPGLVKFIGNIPSETPFTLETTAPLHSSYILESIVFIILQTYIWDFSGFLSIKTLFSSGKWRFFWTLFSHSPCPEMGVIITASWLDAWNHRLPPDTSWKRKLKVKRSEAQQFSFVPTFNGSSASYSHLSKSCSGTGNLELLRQFPVMLILLYGP